MRKWISCLVAAAAFLGLAAGSGARAQGQGWTVLFDGKNLDAFAPVGDAMAHRGRRARSRQGQRLSGHQAIGGLQEPRGLRRVVV